MPPASLSPITSRSRIARNAKPIRSTVATATPPAIARLRRSAGSPAAAMPITIALSPASTMSMMTTDASALKWFRRPSMLTMRLAAPEPVELGEFVVAEPDFGGRDVLGQMRELAGAGDRQHHRAAPEEPGERDLVRRRAVRRGDPGERRPLGRPPHQLAGAERVERDKPDRLLGAVVEDLVMHAVEEVVLVLHSGHRKMAGGDLDILDRYLAQPDMAHDPLVDQRPHHRKLGLPRHLRVDAVELPQIDPLDPQPMPAVDRLLAEVFGPPVGHPAPRPRPRIPGLCRHQHPC